ncbi:MAG: divalent-cation tolerance protein CutA [Candidatus Coatesbacteria bacterium]|nr:divalent-cation tolerance protein CutA [Candidatus Coatesbacteria bacterium]
MERESDFIVVFISASSESEARKIAKTLVQDKLAPCVSVLPEVFSTYWWDDDVQSAEESLLIVKTHLSVFEALKARVKKLHSYDVPEIICVPLIKGSEDYMNWMKDYFR